MSRNSIAYEELSSFCAFCCEHQSADSSINALRDTYLSPFLIKDYIEDVSRNIWQALSAWLPYPKTNTAQSENLEDIRVGLDNVRRQSAMNQCRLEALRRAINIEEVKGEDLHHWRELLIRQAEDATQKRQSFPELPEEIIAKILHDAYIMHDPFERKKGSIFDNSVFDLVQSSCSRKWTRIVLSAIPICIPDAKYVQTQPRTEIPYRIQSLHKDLQDTGPLKFHIALLETGLSDRRILDTLLEFKHRWATLEIRYTDRAYGPIYKDGEEVLTRVEDHLPTLRSFSLGKLHTTPQGPYKSKMLCPGLDAMSTSSLRKLSIPLGWIWTFSSFCSRIEDLTIFHSECDVDPESVYFPPGSAFFSLRRLTVQVVDNAYRHKHFEPSDPESHLPVIFPAVEELRIINYKVDLIPKLLQLYSCSSVLRRLEIYIRLIRQPQRQGEIELYRLIDEKYHDLKALSFVWNPHPETSDIPCHFNVIDLLCQPNAQGDWLLPFLEEFEDTRDFSRAALIPLIRFCQSRLQRKEVVPLKRLRLNLLRGDNVNVDKPLSERLHFYVPDVSYWLMPKEWFLTEYTFWE